jgi:two-component system, OmpR family, response regulator
VTKPRILAVDDEPEILAILCQALESDGYEVETAGSAAEFRIRFAQGGHELCIVDLGLPDGTGFDLVREVRSAGPAGILILTGRSSETDHVVGLELGADDYVTKPFRPRELVARVNAVHRRVAPLFGGGQTAPAAAPASVPAVSGPTIDHTFDGYRLSSTARQLWAPDGSEVMLTTAEFSVLLAMLERRGRVLSRDQIMTLARGRDWESYDRAIDGLVSRLRRKVQRPDGQGHYIRTVHGIGYVFGG